MFKRFNSGGKNNIYFVILLIVVICLTVFNVYLAYQYRRLIPYREGFYTLENRTNILNTYYDELQGMHLELRDEYLQLTEEYQQALEEIAMTKSELEQIKNFEITSLLADNEILSIGPGSNTTLSFDLPLSGYAVFNVSSSSDIYLWVGSSIHQGIYYSRQPAFPDTALELNFTLPVSHTLYVFIANIDEIDESDVTITIKHIY
jgi:hypothetical protein